MGDGGCRKSCCGGIYGGELEAGGLLGGPAAGEPEADRLAGGYSHGCPMDGAIWASRKAVPAPAAAVGLDPGQLAGIHLHQGPGLADRAGGARLAPTAVVQIYGNAQHGPTIASDLPRQKTIT